VESNFSLQAIICQITLYTANDFFVLLCVRENFILGVFALGGGKEIGGPQGSAPVDTCGGGRRHSRPSRWRMKMKAKLTDWQIKTLTTAAPLDLTGP